MTRPTARVVQIDDLPWEATSAPQGWGAQRKRLAAASGGAELGASLYKLEAGRTAFPRHFHHGNEEAILVMSGEGTLRLGESRVHVCAGSWVSLPRGAEHAHQLLADRGCDLTYLCVSTMHAPDVTEYPDSGKLGVFAGSAPGGDVATRTRAGFYRVDDATSYWQGEEVIPRKP